MRTRRSLLTLPSLCTFASAAKNWKSETTEKTEAEPAWDRAVEAKGGRKKLAEIRSFSISSSSKWGVRGFNQITVRYEYLFWLPDRLWAWSDERPTNFGLNVLLINGSAGWVQYLHDVPGSEEQPNRRSTLSPDNHRKLAELQLLPFMETAFLRPKLLGASKRAEWFSSKTVIDSQVGEDHYEWHLDPKTHLPRLVIQKTPVPSGYWSREYTLEDYKDVGGLLLPHRWTMRERGRAAPFVERLDFQINVDFDESLFERPPSIHAGPKAWVRR